MKLRVSLVALSLTSIQPAHADMHNEALSGFAQAIVDAVTAERVCGKDGEGLRVASRIRGALSDAELRIVMDRTEMARANTLSKVRDVGINGWCREYSPMF